MDRRIKKTKQSLRKAFADLLSEKKIPRITVKELCDAADITKSTFYSHYHDIYDFAGSIWKEFYDKIIEISLCNVENPDYESILTQIVEFLQKDESLYKTIMYTRKMLPYATFSPEHDISEMLEEQVPGQPPIFYLYAVFITSGVWGIMTRYPLEELTEELLGELAEHLENGFQRN